MTQVSFTHFKGEKNTVAKAYDIIENKLTKIPAENFYHGTFHTPNIKPEELKNYIESIKLGEFIIAGVHQTTHSGACPQDACRTNEVFKFKVGLSLLIIDCDALNDLGITSEEQCINAIRSLDPAC